MEWDGDKLYFTNVATQKAIDRTSDVVLTTTDCNGDPGEDGTDKVLLWTAPMAANSLSTGIIFKFHCDGIISSATNSDLITISADLDDVEILTLTQKAKKLVDDDWHIDANSTQRTIGANGQRALHFHLTIDEAELYKIDVVTVNTTGDMTLKVYAKWDTATAGNLIEMYQGWLEYKN